jgi:hypothetical protein
LAATYIPQSAKAASKDCKPSPAPFLIGQSERVVGQPDPCDDK